MRSPTPPPIALFAACGIALTSWLPGCGGRKQPDTPEARGRQAYFIYCVACHNADPRKDGAQGPAIAGSSLQLLQARVLRQSYPPGYKPKRATMTMPAYPQVKDRLSDLAAFLEKAKEPSEKDLVK